MLALVVFLSTQVVAQLVDNTKAPNTANEGIPRPLIGLPYPSQIGDGRTSGDANASLTVIAFDPFRAIKRGRQLFQRKFTSLDGVGPIAGDGMPEHLRVSIGLDSENERFFQALQVALHA